MQPSQLTTEQTHSRWVGMDQWSADKLSEQLLSSHLDALMCVRSVQSALAQAGDAIVQHLEVENGRLVYAGAGSAGTQACIDGLELPSTFAWPQERLALMLAGGVQSFYQQGGLSEDDKILALRDSEKLQFSAADVLIAVSASGSTPYTTELVKHARRTGALTVAIVNNSQSPMQQEAALALVLDTGSEAVAGSTRLAAASAQKIVLNSLSTLVMARLGCLYDNHMVQMKVSNTKLQTRAARMVSEISGCDAEQAEQHLFDAQQEIPLAVLLAKGNAIESAREKLHRHGGRLRAALEE